MAEFRFRIYQVNDQYTCDKEELFDNLTQLVSVSLTIGCWIARVLGIIIAL